MTMNNQYFEACTQELNRIETLVNQILANPDKASVIDIAGIDKTEYESIKSNEPKDDINYLEVLEALEMCDDENIHATINLDYYYIF